MHKSKESLKKKFARIFPLLNERQRRLTAAAESKTLGRGGISIVSRASGLSRSTIHRGLADLKNKKATERVRRWGGGRKSLSDTFPKIKNEIHKLVDPVTRGDPESLLRWTCKSTRNIAGVLNSKGYSVSHMSVARTLRKMEYSLQANKKTKEGSSHPDRDLQFQFINSTAMSFIAKKCPVISVDTKKKELVGNYKNIGREWEKKGKPLEVKGHDFPDPKVSKAVPYGIYDIADNKGWVNVGTSCDTAEFAVESIRFWWNEIGKKKYKKSKKLLICADSGGSNGSRSHLWKKELQELANETGLRVSVCHFPPGTSKWNKIEHKLFSFITMNWRGRPLTSYRTIIKLIASTKTKSGLTVNVRLDKRKYKKGIKVPKKVMDGLKIVKADFHGEWNYTISPAK